MGRRGRVFLVLFLVNAALCTTNFFLTPNPYAALHSGGVALDALIRSESFAIQSNILTAASLLVASLYAFRTGPILPFFAIVFTFLLFTSGLATAAIFQRPQSYAFDAIMMTMVIALARHGALSEMDGRILRKIFRYSFVILVAAVVLALLKPNVWGFLPFEFSRDSRGEATLAAMTGPLALVPAAAVALGSISRLERALAYLITATVIASTATRSQLAIALIPLLAYVVLQTRGPARWVLVALTGMSLFYGFSAFQDRIILQTANQSVLESTLTGRLDLWAYYWNAFLEHPWLGGGAFLLERASNYGGTAKSEIGVLKTAAEYGLPVALLQLAAVGTALYGSTKKLMQRQGREMDDFTALLVLALTPNFILHDHARVLNFTDILFWYSVFWQVTRLAPKMTSCVQIGMRNSFHGSRPAMNQIVRVS